MPGRHARHRNGTAPVGLLLQHQMLGPFLLTREFPRALAPIHEEALASIGVLLIVRTYARHWGIRNLARLCFRAMLTVMCIFASPLNNWRLSPAGLPGFSFEWDGRAEGECQGRTDSELKLGFNLNAWRDVARP
jgi:hypothetical protein